MRNFIKPFGVGAARVNLHGQSERGDEHHLASFEMIGMDVTLHIRG